MMEYLLKKILKLNNIKFDWDEIIFQFRSHPSYPSLHAATGVLDHFSIENISARVPVEKNTLNQLPDNCIIQIKENNNQFLVLLKINKKRKFHPKNC